jgi:hypothetical protein
LKKPFLHRTTLFIATCSICAAAFASPEKDSVNLAGNLKSFSDQDWAKIAGDHGAEKYEVERGDTLWDISGRLFGDSKVWPKIWEINNSTILNPHMIEPRMSLFFNSGTGTSLPTLSVAPSELATAVNNAGTMTVKNHYVLSKEDRPGAVWDERTPRPPQEWQKLPRQTWENVAVNLPPNIDKDGFDTRNRIYLRKPATGLEIPHYVACVPVKPLGHLEGTRSITTYAHKLNEVTLSSTGVPLETNQVYTLLDPNPSDLGSKDRQAFSYDIVGKVKILGVQSGTYVGEIVSARETIPRGALVVPEIKRYEKRPPIAGASKVKGTILADRRTGAFMSGQHKWIYFDRGTKDGVGTGMIVRIFQNIDPKTNLPLTNGDVFVAGDAQVIQGCENFSIGMFVWSRGEVPEQYEGILLTDLEDEKIRFYFNGEASNIAIKEPTPPELVAPAGIVDQPKPEPSTAVIGPSMEAIKTPPSVPETLKPPEPSEEKEALTPELAPEKKTAEQEDWLDKLDNHKELQSDEENELKELEKFHESETAKAPPADSSPMPTAPIDDSGLPPPPPEASALPPVPDDAFPSQEPVVETPATLVKPKAPKTAKAPKAPPAAPSAPVDESSTEGLAPL